MEDNFLIQVIVSPARVDAIDLLLTSTGELIGKAKLEGILSYSDHALLEMPDLKGYRLVISKVNIKAPEICKSELSVF